MWWSCIRPQGPQAGGFQACSLERAVTAHGASWAPGLVFGPGHGIPGGAGMLAVTPAWPGVPRGEPPGQALSVSRVPPQPEAAPAVLLCILPGWTLAPSPARAVSAVSEGASWGPLSAVQPRSSAHRLHFSRVLVLSDSGPATPGRCWPGRGGQEHGWAEVSARAGRTSVRAQAAWHPVSRASCVRMGGHCRPGGLDLLVSWGRRVASRCRVQPLGFGVTGGARRAPCGLGAASRRLLPGAARSASRSCAAPVPLRGADRCASERPGAGWTPVSRVPGGPWPRSLSADYELRFLKSKCKLR